MKVRLDQIVQMCLMLILLAAAPAFAATVAVGKCMPGKVSFDTLTDAVQGVSAGSTIMVCPGSYPEQVIIDRSLTLKGVTDGNSALPVIVAPSGGLVGNATGLDVMSFFGPGTLFAAQIVVRPRVVVSISGVALDASNSNLPTCSPIVVGILVQDSSATLTDVAVKNQLETGPPPCPVGGTGVGVLAQNDGIFAETIKVQNSTFVNAGQAFESDGGPNNSTVTNSSFSGNPASAANAITIVSGNSTIQGNTIADFNYPPAGTNVLGASFGVFMECVSGGNVANNHISGSQAGIFLQAPGCNTAGVSITDNDVSRASLIGIALAEENGLVQGNDIQTSLTAIRLSAAAIGNTIQNNTINDACAAFGVNPAAGTNTLLNNKVFNTLNQTVVNTTALCP